MANYEAQNYIVTNGLVLNLDAGDPDSYTRSQPPYVEVLVVAGGGCGGNGNNVGYEAGGGGAGGVLYNSAYQLTSATAITVTIGAGGASKTGAGNGNNGSNSVFGSLTAIGGGGGSTGNGAGQSGGSGGGGAHNQTIGGAGTPGQGFQGVTPPIPSRGGGGGGAGGTGNLGVGGDGAPYSISGTSTYYGGGGGGTVYSPNNGGLGGGGNGSTVFNGTSTATGAANTGGGGGGGYAATDTIASGGAGGSGIVIIRYPGLPASTGGTITYINGYTIHTFTSSGTFTPYLINDITGNGFNGTLENGVGFNSYQNGGSLIFDGSDDQIPVASSNNFANYSWSSGITVMVAYYIDNILDFNNQFRALMGVTGANRSFNYYLYGPNASSGLLRYHFSSIYGSGFSTDVSISNNTWYIGAFTSNGSTGTYYHNNVAVDTQAMGTQSYTTAGGLQYFGRADNYWQGRIGYWLIYNRALSTTELTQNYNAQKNRFGL
jgi:hypothetical protein